MMQPGPAMQGLSPRARGNLGQQAGSPGGEGPIPASAGQPCRSRFSSCRCGAYPRERGATRVDAAYRLILVGLSPRARGNHPRKARHWALPGPIPASAGQPGSPTLKQYPTRAYPRERGATGSSPPGSRSRRGLSPRARGNLHCEPLPLEHAGPIPASAGQPGPSDGLTAGGRAYPRERGATGPYFHDANSRRGLSPRARGNPAEPQAPGAGEGPIPASAGQPGHRGAEEGLQGAYPRERGATQSMWKRTMPSAGLSPRARGNLTVAVSSGVLKGPIPASAGQPPPLLQPARVIWAYPRERGATPLAHGDRGFGGGLSPRARGNQGTVLLPGSPWGPIPASAGQPALRLQVSPADRAYPRERGATADCVGRPFSAGGLSPRARGNLTHAAVKKSEQGPIPASAGQPLWPPSRDSDSQAYPRERGATVMCLVITLCRLGLSPRARGNRPVVDVGRLPLGPIPASAGQPPWQDLTPWARRAYPRERGATLFAACIALLAAGLSPRARGNPGQCKRPASGAGPIPASAGQPCMHQTLAIKSRAYPRERGATRCPGPRKAVLKGLSPRARGNLGRPVFVPTTGGPIPASAGQPCYGNRIGNGWRAYPRERGATVNAQADAPNGMGLSPRARGNRLEVIDLLEQMGPIPASAGQPRPSALPRGAPGAYPRERGATVFMFLPFLPVKGLSPRARGNRALNHPRAWL